MFRLVTVLVLTVTASACQTFASVENLASIEFGMTKAQVSKLAGSPTHGHLEAEREAWEYCVNGWIVDDYALVWFDGDQVIGKNLLEDYEFGLCRSSDEAFSWENAPSS